MLFDLRGRGRRRTVQVIYASLAILLGGGLVLFGIGGDVSGGLWDGLFGDGRSNSASQVQEDEAKDAREAVKKDPQDARSWAVLADREYRLAGVSKGFNPETGEFKGESRERLLAAEKAWDRHVQLAGDKPNLNAAGIARQMFSEFGLNKPEKAVQAQEILIEGNPNAGFGDYAQLAAFAYQANQTRKGDLAARKAIELAPKDQKSDVKQSIEAIKAQQASAAAQAATGGASPGATPPPAPNPEGE